jgi:hypothetical protein
MDNYFKLQIGSCGICMLMTIVALLMGNEMVIWLALVTVIDLALLAWRCF